MSKKPVTKKTGTSTKKKITPKKKVPAKKSPASKKIITKRTSIPKRPADIKKVSTPKKLFSLLPSLFLAFVPSFMFFIFEPITMYATNPNDFWFDIHDIFSSLLLFFTVSSLTLFCIFSIFQFTLQKLLKKPTIFYIFLSIIFCIFVITYIQGNFLAGSLPGINGEIFNWRLYKTEAITSVILWIICFAGLLFSLIKFKPKKVFSIIPYATGAIFIVLAVSLGSTILTTNVLEDKPISVATYDNFNLVSKDQNVFILLVDAIDSRSFNELLENNSNYQKTFKDFTYYPDTLSFYPYTRDSIPYIFNPVPNHNETDFATFSRKVYSESPIFNSLREDNYNLNFYKDSIFMNKDMAANFDNLVDNIGLDQSVFLREIIRYDLYKYLPYPLKGKPRIEKLSFSATQKKGLTDNYTWKDLNNYKIFQNEAIETTEQKVFHFIHLEGAHIWFNLDENVNPIDAQSGTYAKKQAATFKIIQAYIDRLKEADVYDDSAIIIMADHGYKDGVWEYDYILDRFNPILYIKGVDEHHNKMQISNKPVAFEDLSNAINDLRLKKKSTELFKDINYPRTRTLMYYIWSEENHMVEYETDGKAWESDKMRETGNVYDLKE